MTPNNKHIYKGNGPFCLTCLKIKSHSDHLISANSTISVTEMISKTRTKEVQDHAFTGSTNVCESCLKDRSETIHQDSRPVLLSPDGKPRTLCTGHKCPSCLTKWSHEYQCNHNRDGLCETCASQTAAEINRPSKLPEIAQQKYITSREAIEIQCEHDSVVFNMIHTPGPNGSLILKADWQQLISDHILNLQQMIERTKNKLTSVHKRRATHEIEEMTKLTPEEQETYRRSAQKLKVVKAEKVEKEKKKKVEDRDYKIGKLAAIYQSMNPKLSKEAAMKRAEASFEEVK